jgi:hypothetical protein
VLNWYLIFAIYFLGVWGWGLGIWGLTVQRFNRFAVQWLRRLIVQLASPFNGFAV